MKRPSKLYQYQTINNYTLNNLKRNQIYFNSPLNFNDPFDCLHTIKIKPLSVELICDIYGKANSSPELSFLAKKIFDNSITSKQLISFLKKLFQNAVNSGKQFTPNISLEEYTNQLMKDFQIEEIFENQKKEAIKIIREIVNNTTQISIEKIRADMVKKHGVSCFSELHDDMLMWSYYADGHKGFCLEFDTNYEPFLKAKEVKYVIEAPIFNPASILEEESIDNDNLIEIFLSTKFKEWEREKEWRLLHKKAGTAYGYSSKSLTGIYFGAKIDSTSREILLTVLKSQNPFVKFYFMEKDPSSFKVSPHEINYLTHLEGQNLFLNQIISNFSNQKFNISDVLNNPNLIFHNSNIETYLENLVHLGTIAKDDENYRINFQ